MTYKAFSFAVVICFLIGIAFIGIINFTIDPFQIYRQAKLYNFQTIDQRYLNAGLAKNYPYNTLVVGSSMVENFYLKDIEKNPHFTKALKLAYEGGSIYEENQLMNLAITVNSKLKNIIFDLDFYSFSNDETMRYLSSIFPTYLYDQNYINDLSYLLNLKLLSKSFKALKHPYNAKQVTANLNSLYNWQKKYKNMFKLKNISIDYKKNIQRQEKNNFNLKILESNFEHYLLPIIKKNPQINFYIFYPPYSIASYKAMDKQKILSKIISFKRHIYEVLKQYPNVRLYDFQVAKEIVLNLHNYKDINHYNESINKMLLKYIESKKYIVNDSNIEDYLKILNSYKSYNINKLLLYNSKNQKIGN